MQRQKCRRIADEVHFFDSSSISQIKVSVVTLAMSHANVILQALELALQAENVANSPMVMASDVDNEPQEEAHNLEIIDLVSESINESSANSNTEDSAIDAETSSDSFFPHMIHAASQHDIVEIHEMLTSGRGLYGHPNCVLRHQPSLLTNAGYGIFLADGAVLQNGRCISEYDGTRMSFADFDALPEEDRLYGFCIDDVLISGLQQPIVNRGLGSFFNSAVANRCLSFVRPVSFEDRIFFMCSVCDEYPLIGPIELYFTAGIAWWKLFRRVQRHRQLEHQAMMEFEHAENDED